MSRTTTILTFSIPSGISRKTCLLGAKTFCTVSGSKPCWVTNATYTTSRGGRWAYLPPRRENYAGFNVTLPTCDLFRNCPKVRNVARGRFSGLADEIVRMSFGLRVHAHFFVLLHKISISSRIDGKGCVGNWPWMRFFGMFFCVTFEQKKILAFIQTCMVYEIPKGYPKMDTSQ